jgi:hypothetical protein
VGIPLRSLHLLLNPPDTAVVAVIRAYFDNSGNQEDPQHKWLTLGGYLANETQWERFEAQWKQNLVDFELPYLHMKLFAHHLPPFERFKTDEQGRRKFLGNCIEAIGGMHPKSICHAIRLEDVSRFNSDFGRSLDAFSVCLYVSYIDIREAYGASNRIELVIDKIEKPNLRIHKANEYARTDSFYTERYGDVSSTIDARPLKDPDSFINVLPMQAADFLVWELRKSNVNIDDWYAQRKQGLPSSEWLNDLARWNLEKYGVLFKERQSLLLLSDAVKSAEGVALDYSSLMLMEKYHPNGWGDS